MRRTGGMLLAAVVGLTSCVGSASHTAAPGPTTVVDPTPSPYDEPTAAASPSATAVDVQPVVVRPGLRVNDRSVAFSVLHSGDLAQGNRLALLGPAGGLVDLADPLPRDASEAHITQLVTRGTRWWAVSFNCTAMPLLGIAVARSTDSGRTWRAPVVVSGVSCSAPSGGRLTMLSDRRGIVDVWQQESTQHFVTSDGGAHWRLDSSFQPSFNANVPAYLPSGVAVAAEAIFEAQLARSTDLGRHWRPTSLGRGIVPKADPVAVGGRIFIRGADREHLERIYSTTDGVHWRPSRPLSCPCPENQTSFVSERVWWTLRQRTSDGGHTWRPVNSPAGFHAVDGAWLTAASSRFAAVVVYGTNSAALQTSRLYRTTDGGRTWQLVRPLSLS